MKKVEIELSDGTRILIPKRGYEVVRDQILSLVGDETVKELVGGKVINELKISDIFDIKNSSK